MICESQISRQIFAIIFKTMNGLTNKLLKNIFNDVQTVGKGGINTA